MAPTELGLGLGLVATLLVATPGLGQSTAAGSWQGPARECRVGGGGTERRGGCQSLRVDQRQAGVLSIRFLGGGDTNQVGRTTFAGILSGRPVALRCQQERCSLLMPINLKVSVVGEQHLLQGGDGQRAARINAQVARGRCRISRRLVQCEARGEGGRRWWGLARI